MKIEDRWGIGCKYKFQQSLEDENLYYFVYIKFYLDNGKKYALVAGKSSSNKVNQTGCDLGFYEYPRFEGEAYDNKKQWCQT